MQYEWIEIANIGRPFAWYYPTHAACNPVPIPFPFVFYTSVYTKMAVQIDGTLFFHWNQEGWHSEEMGPNNQPIPGNPQTSIRGYIAPFWDDLFLRPGRMWYKVVGVAPHRRLVIEYSRTSRLGPHNEFGTPGEFEAILDETTSIITLQYKDVDFGHSDVDFGASATVGIQDTTEHGLQYSYNTPSLSNELAIVYVPPQQTYTTTARSAEVRFAAALAPDRLPIRQHRHHHGQFRRDPSALGRGFHSQSVGVSAGDFAVTMKNRIECDKLCPVRSCSGYTYHRRADQAHPSSITARVSSTPTCHSASISSSDR